MEPWERMAREREAFEREAERLMNLPPERRRAARRALARKHGLLGPTEAEIRQLHERRRDTNDLDEIPF